jgi:hypothetical protein
MIEIPQEWYVNSPILALAIIALVGIWQFMRQMFNQMCEDRDTSAKGIASLAETIHEVASEIPKALSGVSEQIAQHDTRAVEMMNQMTKLSANLIREFTTSRETNQAILSTLALLAERLPLHPPAMMQPLISGQEALEKKIAQIEVMLHDLAESIPEKINDTIVKNLEAQNATLSEILIHCKQRVPNEVKNGTDRPDATD